MMWHDDVAALLLLVPNLIVKDETGHVLVECPVLLVKEPRYQK
jgi:hypothetical protein